MSKLERDFQSNLIKEIKEYFSGSIVMKTDPTYIQGLPDLLILFRDKWAALEVKRTSTAHKQPNQEYYVNKMNSMSFARFISPDNKDSVLKDLGDYFYL